MHQRHIDQIDRMVETKLVEDAGATLDVLMRAMIEGMIDAHSADPELYDLSAADVPHRADGTPAFAQRLHGPFPVALLIQSA